jgi:hypothetical protein
MQVNAEKAAAVFAAALAGDVERLRTLLPPCGDPAGDGAPAAAAPGGRVTPLMAAAAGGREAAVELLLRCGADPARRDGRGRTAAFYAREAGHHHLAERLDTVVDQEKTIW